MRRRFHLTLFAALITASAHAQTNPLWHEEKIKNYLPHMTWPEVEDLLTRTDMVIIPVASLEEHGPQTPIGTDFLNGVEEAKLIAKWAPMQEGGNSQGPASVNLIEGAGTLTGTISSGAFEGHAVSGSLTEAYTGGPECGKGTVHKGKEKKAKKVSKGTASGTLSVS